MEMGRWRWGDGDGDGEMEMGRWRVEKRKRRQVSKTHLGQHCSTLTGAAGTQMILLMMRSRKSSREFFEFSIGAGQTRKRRARATMFELAPPTERMSEIYCVMRSKSDSVLQQQPLGLEIDPWSRRSARTWYHEHERCVVCVRDRFCDR